MDMIGSLSLFNVSERDMGRVSMQTGVVQVLSDLLHNRFKTAHFWWLFSYFLFFCYCFF